MFPRWFSSAARGASRLAQPSLRSSHSARLMSTSCAGRLKLMETGPLAVKAWGGHKGLREAAQHSYGAALSQPAPFAELCEVKEAAEVPESYRYVSFGNDHCSYIDTDGAIFSFGSNKYGQLGNPATEKEKSITTLTKAQLEESATQVECGKRHTIALTESGSVYTWGYGGSFWNPGGLGHGSSSDLDVPTKVEGLAGLEIIQIAAGAYHNFALTKDGKVYCWGRGEYGVLGLGDASTYKTPTLMDTFENIDVKFISASKHRFCGAVDANGHLYAWGQDDALQLGLGGEALFLDVHRVENVPRLVEYFYDQDVKVVDISLGQKGMLVCTEDGRVYETGDHKWALPNLVKGDNGNFLKHKIVGVARGNKFGAAVDEHGRLFSWGVNSSGGLGVGMAKTNVVSPVPVPALSDGKVGNRVVSITAGMRNMAAFVN